MPPSTPQDDRTRFADALAAETGTPAVAVRASMEITGYEPGSAEHEQVLRHTKWVMDALDAARPDELPAAREALRQLLIRDGANGHLQHHLDLFDAQAAREDTEEAGWVAFPLDVLPGPVKTLCEVAAIGIGCDPAMIAVPVLAALAGAIGNSLRVQIKPTWSEPATIWAAVIAPSGAAKTPSANVALRPIMEIEDEYMKAFFRAQDEYDEAIEQYATLDKAQRGSVPRPKPPVIEHLVLNDCTVEAVVKRLTTNPRGLMLVRDELAGWIGSFNRYTSGGGDLQSWLEIESGVPTKKDRASAEVPVLYCKHPAVSLSGTIQPVIIQQNMTATNLGSGLLARFFLARPPVLRRVFNEMRPSEEVEAAYARIIRRLHRAPYDPNQGPLKVSFSPAAREVFGAYYDDVHDRLYRLPEGPLRAFMSKLAGRTARFALILAAAEHAIRTPHDAPPLAEITAPYVERAIVLARWFGREAARIYDASNLVAQVKSGDAVLVERALAAAEKDGDFDQDAPEFFRVEHIRAALRERGEASSKSEAYRVNKRLTESGLVEPVKHHRGIYRATLDTQHAAAFA